MIGFTLLLANLLAMAPLAWRGTLHDRSAVAAVLLYVAAGEVLETVMWGSWRAGSAGLDLLLFLSLWWAAERSDRWWLILVAGFQLLAVATHLIPLVQPGFLYWTGTTIRLVVWGLMSISFFVGAWEVWAANRFAREERSHVKIHSVQLDPS